MAWILAFVLVLAASLLGCEAGVIVYEEGALDGYTLVCDVDRIAIGLGSDVDSVLSDMLGNEVHRYSGVMTGKMLPGGGYVGVGRPIVSSMEFASLYQVAWDGTMEWAFSEWEYYNDQFGWRARAHHDLQREGNPVGYYAPGQDYIEQGNTLVLAHTNETRPEISWVRLQDDVIYEITWEGNSVFEWHGADHIDEFGLDEAARSEIYSHGSDWLHTNSASWIGENHWYDNGDTRFHPRNVIIDSRHAGFIVIIDYQTGGVVWRVGPDYSEGNPGAEMGPLIGLHHAHMIPKALPGEGNILVFDNGGHSGYGGSDGTLTKYTRDYSRVVEFDPTTIEIVWEYSPANGDYLLNSWIISGAQRLPNGNTLITCGPAGNLLEVTPNRRVVWHYINHYSYSGLSNSVYRAYRIPPQWIPENPGGYSSWE